MTTSEGCDSRWYIYIYIYIRVLAAPIAPRRTKRHENLGCLCMCHLPPASCERLVPRASCILYLLSCSCWPTGVLQPRGRGAHHAGPWPMRPSANARCQCQCQCRSAQCPVPRLQAAHCPGVPAENPDERGWHGVGMGSAWGWHGVGMGLAWGWHGVGMGLAWGWHRVGIGLASGWHGAAWGSHGVRMGFAWGLPIEAY
jgi:hypothetical protein